MENRQGLADATPVPQPPASQPTGLSRYEHASLIVTSNKMFGRWGEVFGDDVVALTGDSYRHRNRDLGRVPATETK